MNTDPTATWFEYLQADNNDVPEMILHATVPANQEDVMPVLLDSIDRSSGWVLHRSRLSRASIQVRLEIQGRHLMDIYAALVGSGLEFSRDSQLLLNDRCTCVQHNAEARRAIQPLRLEVFFAGDTQGSHDWSRTAVA